VWLRRFPSFPGIKTLEVVHFITVDKATKPQVDLIGPVSLSIDPKNIASDGLALSVIPHARLAALTKESSFCCEGPNQKGCERKNLLYIEGAYTIPINQTTLTNGFKSFMFTPPETGLYYITISNCGDQEAGADKKEVKFVSGELSTIGTDGFLPAEEAAKLYFYQYLSIAYVVLLVVWGIWCSAWSEVLFKIHHYITVTIVVGLLEGISWYASLYHWNFIDTDGGP
jgi:hypothetical protein